MDVNPGTNSPTIIGSVSYSGQPYGLALPSARLLFAAGRKNYAGVNGFLPQDRLAPVFIRKAAVTRTRPERRVCALWRRRASRRCCQTN